jgi:hypothetical protein
VSLREKYNKRETKKERGITAEYTFTAKAAAVVLEVTWRGKGLRKN